MTRDETRFSARSWLLLFGAAIWIAISVAQTLYRFSLPSDGWALHADATGWSPHLRFVLDQQTGNAPSPLRAGDAVLAVDGKPLGTVFDDVRQFRSSAPPGWRAGGTATYSVRRADQIIDVEVPLGPQPDPVGAIVNQLVFVNPSVPALLAISLFVLLRRPGLTAAGLLFVFSALFVASALSESVGGVSPTIGEMFDPPGWWLAQTFNNLIWAPVTMPVAAHFFLIFPVRKGPLRRWPRASVLALYGTQPLLLAGLALLVAQSRPAEAWIVLVGLNLVVSFGTVAVACSTVTHTLLTAKDPAARSQIRWLAWAMLVVFIPSLVTGLLGVLGYLDMGVGLALSKPLLLILPGALAIAILRYHVFDIDLVINRSLVYGGLTGVVVATYVGAVTVLGAILREQAGFVPSLVASGLVAVVVQPLREVLQRAVNRLMYGERDEPYAVITRLGRRLQSTVAPDAALRTIAATIARAFRSPYVAIEVSTAAGDRRVAELGRPESAPGSLSVPLTHQGGEIGRLVVAPRGRSESFDPVDRRLLDQLAGQAGMAAHALILTEDLKRSRQRLVAAREEERRRLRRDLHDGFGPTLAAVALQLEAARNLVRRDPGAAEASVAALVGELTRASHEVGGLVDDLRPRSLDELGLVEAIRARAAQFGGATNGWSAERVRTELAVSVETPVNLPQLPAAVEVAAYRIAIEALTNAHKHAGAARCQVTIWLEDDALAVEVRDDGVGLPAGGQPGVGLSSMRERALELGGTLSLRSRHDQGTTVLARFPLAHGRAITANEARSGEPDDDALRPQELAHVLT